jgi:hypothetical protein
VKLPGDTAPARSAPVSTPSKAPSQKPKKSSPSSGGSPNDGMLDYLLGSGQ